MRNLPRPGNRAVRPQRRYLATAVIASLFVWAPDLLAQVATDGSVGAQQNFSGAMIIPENLGRLSGTNLFHSFSIFNINTGESANFTTTTSGITNVISRVTGGSESLINGSLSLTPVDGSPNFFFINPAGVTFGAGASINVPGAFHVSTADYVRFSDGNFYADPNVASTFSSASPEAFGFLGNTRASITVQGGTLLMAQPGQAISLIAGDIRIDNSVVRTRSGDIRVFALGQQTQEVGLGGALPAAAGNIEMSNGGRVIATGFGALDNGNVSVGAGNITIDGLGAGILNNAVAGTTGNAGNVAVNVTGDIEITAGGSIASNTFTVGNAGIVTVNANNLMVDGQGVAATGIFSQAQAGTGNAGQIVVNVNGDIGLFERGQIASSTFTSGNAGSVIVNAENITIDRRDSIFATGIFSQAQAGTGNAGNVAVTATGDISILRGGKIAASTFTSALGGNVTVNARNLTIDRQAGAATGIFSEANSGTGNAGSITVDVSENLNIFNGGEISSNTAALGDAGSVTVSAGTIVIDRQGATSATGIFSQAINGSANTGNAGSVSVVANDLTIRNAGEIGTSTFTAGDAGSVLVDVANLLIDGQSLATGIFSQARAGSGNAGSVQVGASGNISIIDGGQIAASSYTAGSGGSVTVQADNLNIDRQDGTLTGVFSAARGAGNAGSVNVTTTGDIDILHGGEISSNTFSSGNAGIVVVNARNLTVDGQGFASGVFSQAQAGTGSAGSVEVNVSGALTLLDRGQIASSTFTSGNAGSVLVNARDITIDRRTAARATGIFSQAQAGTGNAGDVVVNADGRILLVNGGKIAASTFTSGAGGSVTVNARDLVIDRDGGDVTGIFSEANGGSGDGGDVFVNVSDELALYNGGEISSTTFADGSAGMVTVNAGLLTIDGHGVLASNESGIHSAAGANSSGQTGSIEVSAEQALVLSNGGQISIENAATVANPAVLVPTSISISAPLISLSGDASITAASTGNVAAGNIQVNFDDRLLLDSSRINTSANLGNGGAIDIQGGDLIFLDNSQVTTSVAGLTGNGGDINIGALGLVMQTGFIQANTAAANATGGDVNIDVQLLVPSGNSLFVGGQTPLSFQPGIFGFNVIQAAAPTGVSGNIQITTPALDITGGLKGLSTNVIDDGGLGRNLCQVGNGSSLGPTGRGGLPPSGRNLLRVEDASAAGVEQPGAALDLKDASLASAQSGCVL